MNSESADVRPQWNNVQVPAEDVIGQTVVPDVVDVIVDDAPADGRHNMAVDATLLETGLSGDRCIVRIYRWREPTVTLGYFQRPPYEMAPALKSLPAVTRLSGGGAILHDQEVTYSCVIPSAHPLHDEPSRLYTIVHRAVVSLLRQCGCESWLRSELAEEDPGSGVRQDDPFLCFLRADPNDIVCQPLSADAARRSFCTVKIVGSAQRRRRGTVLQHGSILLSASSHLPEVPGISQLFPAFCQQQFLEALPGRIGLALGDALRFRPLDSAEQLRVDELTRGVEQSREL